MGWSGTMMKTVKTVPSRDPQHTPLKRGVNGSANSTMNPPSLSGYHFAWKYGFVDYLALGRLLPG
jgi:hypothetical protein